MGIPRRLNVKKPEIKLGAAYSNGDFGKHWVVRQVLLIEASTDAVELDHITFKVLVGHGRRSKLSCTRGEFMRWMRYEVVRNENSWERVD
jgi:CBS domain-containing membrane protein